ncbi:MAG TPA: substrate-binding domain-containing protein, partial [Ilumatobacteraceae bacterium]|nr:substrate-binding domain-containing protein [Ilumatobacteraceae bacterium]
VIPDDTTGFSLLAAISNSAPHPSAAELFVSFLLSEQGQAIAVADIAIPVLPSVSAAVQRPAGYVPSDNAATAARMDQLTSLLGA